MPKYQCTICGQYTDSPDVPVNCYYCGSQNSSWLNTETKIEEMVAPPIKKVPESKKKKRLTKNKVTPIKKVFIPSPSAYPAYKGKSVFSEIWDFIKFILNILFLKNTNLKENFFILLVISLVVFVINLVFEILSFSIINISLWILISIIVFLLSLNFFKSIKVSIKIYNIFTNLFVVVFILMILTNTCEDKTNFTHKMTNTEESIYTPDKSTQTPQESDQTPHGDLNTPPTPIITNKNRFVSIPKEIDGFIAEANEKTFFDRVAETIHYFFNIEQFDKSKEYFVIAPAPLFKKKIFDRKNLLFTILPGNKCKIISEDDEWIEVKSLGRTGWIYLDFIPGHKVEIFGDEHPRVIIEIETTDIYNIRRGPGTRYSKIGEARNGDRFYYLETSRNLNWAKIEDYKGNIGWIWQKGIKGID